MRCAFRIWLFVTIVVVAHTAACTDVEQPELRGGLYFASGNYLAQLDLRDGSTSVIANLGDAEIREISPQLDERLLLSVFGNINQQDTHRLVLFDLATRQALTLINGRYGRYLPGTRILVYDDGIRILVAERVSGTWEKTEVSAHRFNAPVRILPISASRFLYAVAGETVRLYDNAAKRSIDVAALGAVCDLDFALWFPGREQLLCRTRSPDGGSYEYPFVGLDGTVHDRLPLPETKSFRPLVFLPDQGAVVLTEVWRGVISDRRRSAIWIYRLDDGALYRLVEDQYLGRWVVYSRT